MSDKEFNIIVHDLVDPEFFHARKVVELVSNTLMPGFTGNEVEGLFTVVNALAYFVQTDEQYEEFLKILHDLLEEHEQLLVLTRMSEGKPN
jgi:hypothetical protein